MTWNPGDPGPQSSAGLFGRRFRRPPTDTPEWFGASGDAQGWSEPSPNTSEWFTAPTYVDEADIRLVDSTVDLPPPTARVASSVSYDAVDGRAASVYPPGIPQRHAQGVWEILLSLDGLKDLPQELACTKQSLTTALYPPAPTPSSWLHRAMSGTTRKRTPPEVLALEVAGTADRLQFFLRGPVPGIARLFDHLRASHNEQLERAIADTEQDPRAEPLHIQPGEAMSVAELHLESPTILPLKTTETPSCAEESDPLSGLLSVCTHTADFSSSLRVVSQLLITPAPQRWKRRNQALLDKQRAQRAAGARPNLMNESGQEGLVVLILVGIGVLFLAAHGLLFLLWACFLPLLVILGTALFWWKWRRWRWSHLLLRHEPAVIAKLSQEVAQVCLRLYVIGPAEAPQVCEAALDRLIGAYGAFASLNRWKVGKRQRIEGVALAYAQPGQSSSLPSHHDLTFGKSAQSYLALFDIESAFRPQSWWQCLHFRLSGDQVRPVLGMNEVAALWHLPTLGNSEIPDT